MFSMVLILRDKIPDVFYTVLQIPFCYMINGTIESPTLVCFHHSGYRMAVFFLTLLL